MERRSASVAGARKEMVVLRRSITGDVDADATVHRIKRQLNQKRERTAPYPRCDGHHCCGEDDRQRLEADGTPGNQCRWGRGLRYVLLGTGAVS
jgi:hypothetical protein